MASQLDRIKAPIAQELDLFEKHFRQSMKSPVPLLDRITYYIVQRKGKQVRPMFVFLSAQVCGGVQEATYVAASLVELLHTATLVHDDVVDDSYERRGFFSINALWKNKVAVLVGDFLLSQGLLLSLKNKEYRILEILSNAIREMAEGELLQMEKARRLDIQENVYFDIIRQKTASLIAGACSAGAYSASRDDAQTEHMRLFGEKIGIAFQIKDDLFDLGDSNIGKPRGIDIKEKKLTLPIIYALGKSDDSTKKHIINLIRKHNDKPAKVREVIDFVRGSGGMDYARDTMMRYMNEAFALLDQMPPSQSREALRELVFYVTSREK